MASLLVRVLLVQVMGLYGAECVAEFFYRTHDPTTVNRQGNDTGTRKDRSAPST